MTTAFIEALRGAARPVIMEVKRKDGRGNDLLGERTVAEIVAGYESVGAPCISVVTGRWFGGTEELLREVSAQTRLPLLQKDFITTRRQLLRAQELGVAAVLLTAALLPRAALPDLVEQCLALGLTPFVEVTSEAEIASLPRGEACVVAVNNKDIRGREIEAGDVQRSLSLLPAVMRSGTRCPVSASGIDHPEVAARLLGAGFAGLLMGTELLRARDLPSWLEELDRLRAVG